MTCSSHAGGGFRRFHHGGGVPPHSEPEDRRQEASAVRLRALHRRPVREGLGALPAVLCQGPSAAQRQSKMPENCQTKKLEHF